MKRLQTVEFLVVEGPVYATKSHDIQQTVWISWIHKIRTGAEESKVDSDEFRPFFYTLS